MTEKWVLQKILEHLQKQPTQSLNQLMIVDEETGEVKEIVTEQVGDSPPVIRKQDKE